MNIHDLRGKKGLTPEELVAKRKAWGFSQYAIEVRGIKVDKALFMDTSWESLEEIADSIIYLEFELDKLDSQELRMEAIRIRAMIKVAYRLMHDLFAYRERVKVSCPDLLESKVPEGEV